MCVLNYIQSTLKKNFELIFLPELLQKDNKDKEERFNKVKAVAVKAKKELDLSKKEVKKKKICYKIS